MSEKPLLSSARVSALIRLAREHPGLDDLAIEALAIVQTAPRVPPDPGDEMPIEHPGYDTTDEDAAIRQMASDELSGRGEIAVQVELAAVEWRFRLSTAGEGRLTDDERRLVAGAVNRAREAALDQIAGLRSARRASDIRANAATEIPRLLGMPVDTVVLSTADHDTAVEMMQVIDNERTKNQPFIVFMDVIGIVEVHDNSTGAWKTTKHHI